MGEGHISDSLEVPAVMRVLPHGLLIHSRRTALHKLVTELGAFSPHFLHPYQQNYTTNVNTF